MKLVQEPLKSQPNLSTTANIVLFSVLMMQFIGVLINKPKKIFPGPGNFISNFQCLDEKDAKEQISKTLTFDQYTDPMRDLILSASGKEGETSQFVSSANPRIVDGKPTKNPRYLQTRPDLFDPKSVYLALAGTRLRRKLNHKHSGSLSRQVSATRPS